MDAKNNLLNYYINYEVRKNRDYLRQKHSAGHDYNRPEHSAGRDYNRPEHSAGRDNLCPEHSDADKNLRSRTRGPNLAQVAANLSRAPVGKGFQVSLTPANSIEIAQSEISDVVIDNQQLKASESGLESRARDISINLRGRDKGEKTEGDKGETTEGDKGEKTEGDKSDKTECYYPDPDLNQFIPVKDVVVQINEDDEVARRKSAMARGRRRSSVVPGNRSKRSYRHSNARPQLYDVVAKQRQFDRLYRLTDYEADPVKNRRERLKKIFTQICRDRGRKSKEEEGEEGEEGVGAVICKETTRDGAASGSEDEKELGESEKAEEEEELPVYLQLLAMQPALVPISMLLPPGGCI